MKRFFLISLLFICCILSYAHKDYKNQINDDIYNYNNVSLSSTKVSINTEAALKICEIDTTIVVAIIDDGVDFNHEDLVGCILDGYTVGYAYGNGSPLNLDYLCCKGHGTACAGIIAALNNSIGITGIASGVKILPINVQPYAVTGDSLLGHGTGHQIAEAIKWASSRADILCCSWGWSNESAEISNAVKYAMKNGRNGKGNIVIAASGDYSNVFSDISFPGNMDGVITVANVDNYGVIVASCQHGKSMDLVAPADNILTTDRMGNLGYTSDNYCHVSGSTIACSQVAGVTALMLSANPQLTGSQVRTILQETATDLGTTGFDTTYGYGLVNAEAALKKILSLVKIEGKYMFCTSASYSISNLPVGYDVEWSTSSSICSVSTGADCSKCLVTKENADAPFYGTLTAVLKYKGAAVHTITKDIISHGKFYGTYSQTLGAANPQVDVVVQPERPYWVQKSSRVTITSDNFREMNITVKKDDEIIGFSDNANHVYFTIPYEADNYTPVLIEGKSDEGCNDFRLVFFPLIVTSVKATTNGGMLEVTLLFEQEGQQQNAAKAVYKECPQWTLNVVNVSTGQNVFSGKINEPVANINTCSWIPGVYIVSVQTGDENYNEKIVIQ